MTADALLKQARTFEARDLLQAEIRQKPGDGNLRLRLFQVLVVLGAWERAMAQLETVVSLDPSRATACDLLGGLVQLERWRESVFAGERAPAVAPAAEWLEEYAAHCGARGKPEVLRALKARTRALKKAPARAGRIDGARFDWVMDADARFGPSLELYSEGKYTWLPLEHVRSVTFVAPQSFLDLVWLPVRIKTVSGGRMSGHVPARYPGSGEDSAPEVQLARTAVWTEPVPGFQIGSGVRVLSTDDGDHPITKVRLLEFAD